MVVGVHSLHVDVHSIVLVEHLVDSSSHIAARRRSGLAGIRSGSGFRSVNFLFLLMLNGNSNSKGSSSNNDSTSNSNTGDRSSGKRSSGGSSGD